MGKSLSKKEESMQFQFRTVVILALLCVITSAPAEAARIISGPLVGHTTTTSARIWIETDAAAKVRIDYWVEPRIMFHRTFREPMIRGSAEGTTESTTPYTCAIELSGLPPGRLVYYDVNVDGKLVRPQTVQVFPLMPPESISETESDRITEFTVAFGSCNLPARVPVQSIWSQVARFRPAAFLFIGDNNYMPGKAEGYDLPEAGVREIMSLYHRRFRQVPGLRDIVATTPSYGIWDDHDYGPNNSDRTFKWRDLAIETFRRYWPNPYAESSGVPGVFHRFRIADVEFFMLDNRSHRDPNEAEDRSTMFGEGQIQWLKAKLKSSTATFKVIASGGTAVVDGTGETWANFGDERDGFIAWLFAENITGVFFLAGDWHVGGLHRLYRPGFGYPLYELMSSNLAVRRSNPDPTPDGRANWGGGPQSAAPYVADYNFGLLRFVGEKGKREVYLQIVDDSGKIRISQLLSEEYLRTKAE